MASSKPARFALAAHRLLALTIGLWLSATALLGGLIVFRFDQPGAAAAQQLFRAAENLVSPSLALQQAETIYPGHTPPRLLFPTQPGGDLVMVFFQPDGQAGGTTLRLALDPVTAALRTKHATGQDRLAWVAALHEGDWLGPIGPTFTFYAGLLVIALVAVGLVALRANRLRSKSARPLRGLQRLRTRHRALGMAIAAPLMLTALSGTALLAPRTTRSILQALFPETEPTRHHLPAAAPAGPDEALATARRLFPGWAPAFMDIPAPGARKPFYGIALIPPEPQLVQRAAWVVVDQRTGKAHGTPPGRAQAIRAWMRALHRAEVFGPAYRAAMLLLAVTPTVMAMLGLAIWRRRTHTRRTQDTLTLPVESP